MQAALEAARLMRSPIAPHGILRRANVIWRSEHPESFYGGSYKCMDPWTHFDQQLGLVISTAISSHLLRAHNRMTSRRPMECTGADVLAAAADEAAALGHPEEDPIDLSTIAPCCCPDTLACRVPLAHTR